MSKKNKNIALIISIFLLLLFLNDMVITIIVNKIDMDSSSFERMMEIRFIYPFIGFSILALIVRFNKTLNKKIDKTYRKIIYYLPVYALIMPIPIGLLSGYFLKIIHII